MLLVMTSGFQERKLFAVTCSGRAEARPLQSTFFQTGSYRLCVCWTAGRLRSRFWDVGKHELKA
jgi:hypothetical protein